MKTVSNVLIIAVLVASALVIPRISLNTKTGEAAEDIYPGATWATATPAEMGLDPNKLNQAVNYAGGSGYIIRGGKVVRSWGNDTTLYDMRSTTKSIGSIATALAIADGKLSLDDRAQQRHPSFANPPASNASTGWVPGITLRHLATHTAGFDKDGGYTSLLFKSGTKWSYSDSGANWLAEITTLAHGQDLNTVLFNRVFTPIGIKSSDLTWRANQYRGDTINGIKSREFGSGIRANVNAMARIGYLFLRNGKWYSNQLIPQSYIDQARQPQSGLTGIPEHFPNIAHNGSDHYGLLWWNNADGTLPNAPTDTYWAWGLGESLIVVYPSLDIVAVRAGNALQSGWEPNYNVVKPFIEPIAQAVTLATPTSTPAQTASSGGTTIDIYATAAGTPRMELRINDQTVQSYNVVGTGSKYTYVSASNISVGQIKVAFVNDNANNDLIVDRIVVNGTTYQTEAPTTFSTGVYANGKCQSQGGYFQKEKLSCNGYFKYAN